MRGITHLHGLLGGLKLGLKSVRKFLRKPPRKHPRQVKNFLRNTQKLRVSAKNERDVKRVFLGFLEMHHVPLVLLGSVVQPLLHLCVLNREHTGACVWMKACCVYACVHTPKARAPGYEGFLG